MSVDWKKVAADRLQAIRTRDRRLADISARAAEIVTREILRDLHARCISVSAAQTQKMAAAIGARVAEVLTGIVPKDA